MRRLLLLTLICIVCTQTTIPGQVSTSLYSKIYNFPDKLFGTINSKSQSLQEKLTKQTGKYLSRLAKDEKKLKRQLSKKDSTAATELFGDVDARYASLKGKLSEQGSGNKLRNVYTGHMNSKKTTLSFLDQNNLLKQSLKNK